MSGNKARKVLIKTARVFAWIVLSVFGLLIIIALSIQIPWVQKKGKEKAIGFLEEKIGTTVHLERFSLSFPKKIVLTGFYLEDQQRDTLLYAGRLGIDTDLWALTKHRIELNNIELENFTARVSRAEKDSAFNFDYILKAFADTTQAPKDTVSTPWAFGIGNILLEDIRLSLDDYFGGNHMNIQLGELEIFINEFDLENSNIDIDEVNLERIHAQVKQTKIPEVIPDSVEVVPEDSTAIAFNIDFNEINLSDVEASYNHTGLGQLIHVSVPEAAIEADAIDIRKQIIHLSRIMLHDSHISFQQMNVDRMVAEHAVDTVAQQDDGQEAWSFMLDDLDLSGNTIQYHDYTQPVVSNALDFNHLWISKLKAKAKDIRVLENDIRATINDFAFQEKSGFLIKTFRTVLAVNKTSVSVRNFLLQTGNSSLALQGESTFPSLETIGDRYAEAVVSLEIKRSSINVRDALYFHPHLFDSLSLKRPENGVIITEAAVNGSVNDLHIERLQVHALNNTSLFMNGKIAGLPEIKSALMQIKLDKFHTTRMDIQSIVPDTLIPKSIELPEWIDISAKVNGTINTPTVVTTLATNLGKVNLDAALNLTPGIVENYNAEVAIHQFDIGTLLKQPDKMGVLDMVSKVHGKGVKMDELNAMLELVVNEFQYNGYTYRDFRLNGSMKEYFYTGEAMFKDENLDFTLNGDFDYRNEVPYYAFTFDLKNADFEKLNLIERPMKARGTLAVDLKTSDFKVLNGNVGIRDFAVFNGESLYAVDSLLVASLDQEGTSELTISSEIISGSFKGSLNVFALPDLLNRHLNHYFSMRDTVYETPVAEQHFKFNLVIKNTDLITEVILPELEPFVPGEITGEFNSAEKKLDVRFELSEINYAGVLVDTVSLKVISDPKSFDFTFNVNGLAMDTLQISALRLAGNIMNDSIHTNFMILDSLAEEKYFLGGVFNSFEDAFQFRFLQNHIKLNYEEWEAPLYNSLRFTDAGVDPNNFWIRKGNERILLLKQNDTDSTLSIVFNEVDLKNITSVVEGTTPISGIMNGDVNLSAAQQASFDTDFRIKNLNILEQPWGNLALLLGKEGNNPLEFKLTIDGENAALNAVGKLTSDAEPVIDLKASIPRLNLAIVEPLTMGQLKNLTGELSATLDVHGKTKDPEINARLSIHKADFLATYVNSQFFIVDENIDYSNSVLTLNKFEIFDSKKNSAVINGSLAGLDQGGWDLRLSLDAKNFQLLNTTAKDNDLFYGNVRINTAATIRGTSILPVVKMNVSLVEGSQVTYVVPQSEKGILDQKGIVEFIDKDAKDDPFMAKINPNDTIKSTFSGMDLTANIELTDQESFNVIIDPLTGDNLAVKGNSTLTLHMEPSGEMELTGRYEISEGSYDLSFYKLVKRKFLITKGSTMTWSGDPMNADMNISALYEVETSPIELVANQVQDDELTMYKEMLPFQVFLIIKGELLSPEISFRLDMPEDEQNAFGGNVYAKIQDINTRESDLNKQVFALLLLKRFISDNPFENKAAGGLASSARTSVSKILSEQLNRLSSNVKGVELSFDLKSYEGYSSGKAEGRTDLELGVSKSLLNDRLVVKVAGNVNLEGETADQQNSVTDFIGDLALEYKLTEDGRFRITGFRNSNYDMIDGDLIETGAGLIYIKDYDTLRELFKANEKNK